MLCPKWESKKRSDLQIARVQHLNEILYIEKAFSHISFFRSSFCVAHAAEAIMRFMHKYLDYLWFVHGRWHYFPWRWDVIIEDSFFISISKRIFVVFVGLGNFDVVVVTSIISHLIERALSLTFFSRKAALICLILGFAFCICSICC